MPRSNNRAGAADTKERLACGFSYLSMGMVGLVYYLMRGGRSVSSFFLFHFYQSILCGIFILLFNWTSQSLIQVIGGLLLMALGQSAISVMTGAAFLFDIIGKGLLLVLLYGAVFAFLGKLADVPGIAKLARMQMR